MRNPISVRKQYRKALRVRFHSNGIFTQHVRTIREESNAPESFGFALRAQQSARSIETHQLGIRHWPDFDLILDRCAVVPKIDDKLLCFEPPLTFLSIDRHGQELEVASVEPERLIVISVPLDDQGCADACPVCVQIDVETYLRNQPVGGPIVLAPDR